MFLNHNGNILPVNTLLFGSANRAFRYGDGLFETIRMNNGEVRFLDWHLERLYTSMQLLQLPISTSWTIDFWQQAIADLCKRNKIFKEARIKLTVYRASEEGFYTPKTNSTAFLLELHPLGKSYELNAKGLLVDIYTQTPKNTGKLAHLKTCNALPYILAGIWATQQKVDDCLLVNEHNRLIEATASNLFLVKNNQLYTPQLAEGCIAGVMRRHIAARYSVIEQAIPEEALLEADEVLLTNTIHGVQWVGGYKNKRYFSKVAKELVALISKK